MATPTFPGSQEGSVTGGVVVVSDSFVTIESARPACRDRGVPLVPVPTVRAAISALERAAAAVVVADAAAFHSATPKETAQFLEASQGSSLVVVYPTTKALLRLPPGVTERSVLTMPRTEVVGLLPLKLRELFGEDLRPPDEEQTGLMARPVFVSVPDFDELIHQVEDGEVFEGPPGPDEEEAEDFMEVPPQTQEVAYLSSESHTAEGASSTDTASAAPPSSSTSATPPAGPVALPSPSLTQGEKVPLPSPPAEKTEVTRTRPLPDLPPGHTPPPSSAAPPTKAHDLAALAQQADAQKVPLPDAGKKVPLPAADPPDAGPPPTDEIEMLDSDSFAFDIDEADDDGPPTLSENDPVPLPAHSGRVDTMPPPPASALHSDTDRVPAAPSPSTPSATAPASSSLDPADRPPDPQAASEVTRSTKLWEERTEVTGIFDRELTQVVWATKAPQNAIPTVAEKNEYEIERIIGKGKNATVYLARWPGEVEYVALKVLDPALAAQEKFKLRFRREIRSQAVLNHANIVRVKRFGRRKGSYYVAFELVLGNLADVLADHGPLPMAVVVIVLDRMLAALEVAHRRGVFHRALKPSNLMVTHHGEIKLGDFSVAKSTLDTYESVHGARLGSAEYFSPEQAMGDKIGPKTDLFSLATVATELLTGENPYDKKTFGDTILAVSGNAAPFAPSLSPRAPLWLSCFVRHLHMRDVAQRPGSANAARNLLAPLTNAVQSRYPDLLAKYFASPRSVQQQLEQEEADALAQVGLKLAHGSPSGYRRAALILRRARALDRRNTEVAQVFDELREGCGFRFLKPDLKSGRGTPADIEDALESGRLLDYVHGLLVEALSSPFADKARQDLVELIGPPDQALPQRER